MGGEGSILAMIISLKNNRAMLRSKRRQRPGPAVRHQHAPPPLIDKRMTPEAFAAFRKRLKREKVGQDLVRFTLLFSGLAAAAVVIYLIFKAMLNL